MKVPYSELMKIESSLKQWRTPKDFAEIVGNLHDRVESKDLWGPQFKFLREGINAADFSRALGCELVRLMEESKENPDFEIQTDGIVKGFELTEAQEVGRRRGDEDWESTAITYDPVENWVARAAMVPGRLRSVVEKKLAKGYAPMTRGLVVYLNIGTYGQGQTKIVADLHDATALAKDAFTEVWVLWGLNWYMLWKNGECSTTVIKPENGSYNPLGASFAELFD